MKRCRETVLRGARTALAAAAAAVFASGCSAPAVAPERDASAVRHAPVGRTAGDKDARERRAVRDEGAAARDAQADLLLKTLKQGNDGARERAAAALGRTGDRRAVEALIAALKDARWEVRSAAAASLAELKDPRARDPLIDALLHDKEFLVRDKAASALGEFRGSAVTDALVEALKRDSAMDETIGRSLARHSDDRLVDRLVRIVNDRANSDLFRIGAARALGEMRSPRSVEPLIELMKRDRDYRVAAIRALGKIRDFRAVEPLAAAMRDDANCAGFAAEALGEIGDRRAVEPLIQAITSHDGEVRAIAVRSLKAITGQDLGDDPARWREWREKNGRAR